ncbi:MAG: hypothetical protein NT069_25275, partial [Planctomycetota bacterium]|nr:hypothetical protein [Planctomycetota bacterium]
MIPIRPNSDTASFSWASAIVASTSLALAIWSLFAPEDKLDGGDLAVAFMFGGLAPGNVRFILLLFVTYFLWGAGMALERHLNSTARWSLALGAVAILAVGFAIWGIAPGAVVAGPTPRRS